MRIMLTALRHAKLPIFLHIFIAPLAPSGARKSREQLQVWTGRARLDYVIELIWFSRMLTLLSREDVNLGSSRLQRSQAAPKFRHCIWHVMLESCFCMMQCLHLESSFFEIVEHEFCSVILSKPSRMTSVSIAPV
jgi:hypothetical protein